MECCYLTFKHITLSLTETMLNKIWTQGHRLTNLTYYYQSYRVTLESDGVEKLLLSLVMTLCCNGIVLRNVYDVTSMDTDTYVYSYLYPLWRRWIPKDTRRLPDLYDFHWITASLFVCPLAKFVRTVSSFLV